MSLTSFIKEPDVRKKFSETFSMPKVNLEAEMKAPPITEHYSLVGTAFDYLLRFYIKRHNPLAKTSKWIAEIALNCIEDENLKTKLTNTVENSKLVYQEYLKNGILTDDVLKIAILLAKIDPIYRAGYIDQNINIVDEGDIEDLRNLINLVDKDSFTAKKNCLLNPTFGNASRLVGGADADIVLDNQIIDMKTTKFLKLKEQDFHQLIGYYILSLIGGIDGADDNLDIKTISIYFCRHGIFLPLMVPSPNSSMIQISEVKFKEFVKWFMIRTSGKV
ncbi:MAG: hypothetical protein ABIC91_07745 [Nanoarchaeota archaeon]